MLSQSCLSCPSCGTTNSGSSGTTRLWPGATSVAATSVWKYSVVPPLRLRVEQHVMPQPTKGCEPAASLQHFHRMGKPRIEAFRLHRVQHIPNMVVARNLRHLKQRLAVRATMAVPVGQVPLMGQERRALHEKHRKRRHADIGHEVMAVLPTPLVRQTRTGRPQPRYKVLDRSHTALESDSRPPAYCQIAPDSICRTPLKVALSAKMRIAGYWIAGFRRR